MSSITLDNDHPIEEPTGGFGLKHGIIIGVIDIVISLLFYFTGLMGESWTPWIVVVLNIVLVYVFQKKFRDGLQGGYINFGKAFGLGVLMYTVAGILGAIFNYILFTMDPSLKEALLEKQEEALLEAGLSTDMIDTQMDMMSSMFEPGMMAIVGIFSAILGGLIISLITSAIVKRKHPNEM